MSGTADGSGHEGRRDGRLSRVDWLDAGQALLVESGFTSLRMRTLMQRLNVSSGSFYHHFSDMDEYLGALAEYYNAARIQVQLAEIVRETEDPLERLQVLARRTWKSDLLQLDAAMRVWAASEPRAAAALREAERVTLTFITEAFQSVGFDHTDAVFRARLFTSLQIANLLSISDDEALDLRRRAFAQLAKPGG